MMRDYLKKNIKVTSMAIGFSLIVILSLIFLGNIYITGNILTETHVHSLDSSFSSDSVILWTPESQDAISSIDISGDVSGTGYYEIILIDGEKEYLIFASSVDD
ncbi:hypothetical protein KY321_00390, partial [Candidatus Woesearchaeota archaeon]|nr:hypothetical protein [Candidatus Woesearchaeota archaeon]